MRSWDANWAEHSEFAGLASCYRIATEIYFFIFFRFVRRVFIIACKSRRLGDILAFIDSQSAGPQFESAHRLQLNIAIPGFITPRYFLLISYFVVLLMVY